MNKNSENTDKETKMYSKDIADNIINYEIFSIICFWSFTIITIILIRPFKSEEYKAVSEEENSTEKKN